MKVAYLSQMFCKNSFPTTVYHKPTFIGLCMDWCSFLPTSRNIELIKTLVYRARRIFSSNKLKHELNIVKNISIQNGYPENVIINNQDKKI